MKNNKEFGFINKIKKQMNNEKIFGIIKSLTGHTGLKVAGYL